MTNTLTPTEVAQQWQAKLTEARRELSDFEADMGSLALTHDSTELAQKLTALKNAVIIAEAAAATASKNAPSPALVKAQSQLEFAQAQLANFKAEANKWAAICSELEPRYSEAKRNWQYAARQMMTAEHDVDRREAELRALLEQAGAA